MKKSLLLLIALFTMTFVSAQTAVDSIFTEGDLRYRVTASGFPSEVEVAGLAEGSTTTILEIPDSASDGVAAFAVNAIGANAFENSGLVEVTLPVTVKLIKTRGFRRCYSLVKINLENVEVFETNALVQCRALKYADISSAISLGTYALYDHALDSIKMAVVQTIEGDALGLNELKRIEFPESVTTIGAKALQVNPKLSQVKVNWKSEAAIPNIFYASGSEVFLNGLGLANMELYVPEGTIALYEAAAVWQDFGSIVEGDFPPPSTDPTLADVFTVDSFSFTVTNLDPFQAAVSAYVGESTVLTIPASATDPKNDTAYDIVAVANDAFVNNIVITEVVLPSSVKSIGTFSFGGCSSLTTINTGELTTINGNAFRGVAITSLDLSEIITLNSNALGRMYDLAGTIDLPKVETIADYAFVFAQNVTTINIGSSLTAVDSLTGNAFFGLPALRLVKVDAETPPATSVAFNFGIKSDRGENDLGNPVDEQGTLDGSQVTLQVLNEDAVAAYGAAIGWNFGTINTDGALTTDVVARELGFNVYPNPAQDVVYVENNESLNATVSIIDMNGRVLSTQTANNSNNSIDVSNLASGVYLMKVTTDTYTFVERIIKQ